MRIVQQDSQRLVRKHRRFYAPLLIWMSGLLVRVLDAGVRVLAAAGLGATGALDLPAPPRCFDSGGCRPDARPAAACWTHAGDVAGGSGSSRSRSERGPWHTRPSPSPTFIAADSPTATRWPRTCCVDLRSRRRPLVRLRNDSRGEPAAGLATCRRSAGTARHLPAQNRPGNRGGTLELILDVYADEDVTRVLATSFTSVWQRSLTLHLLQAPLSFECFCELGRLLCEGSREPGRRDARNAR